MTETETTAAVDALLAEHGLDEAVIEERNTIIDAKTDAPLVAALRALRAEDIRLQKVEKETKARRDAIRKLVKERFVAGDTQLVIVEGNESTVLAKMVYPEPTVSVNTEYVKANFTPLDNPEMFKRTESTPRMTMVQD